MEQLFSRARFLIVHMLQEEAVLMFVITILLLWVLNRWISTYSTKTQEAALSRQIALFYAGIAMLIAVLGRVLR